MAENVRHDLLHSTHESGRVLFSDIHVGCDVDLHIEPGKVAHHLLQGGCEVEWLDSQFPHRGPDIGEQLPRDSVRSLDMFTGPLTVSMPRRLEFQRENSELVTDDVVQVAGDPQSFGGARRFRQQDGRGLQLDMGLRQLSPHSLLPQQRHRAEHRRQLDQEVEASGQHRRTRITGLLRRGQPDDEGIERHHDQPIRTGTT